MIWTPNDAQRAKEDGWRMAPFPHPMPLYTPHGTGIKFSSAWELHCYIADKANADEWYFEVLMAMPADVRLDMSLLKWPSPEKLFALAEQGNARARRLVALKIAAKLREKPFP